MRLYPYGAEHPLRLLGCFDSTLEGKSGFVIATIYVVAGKDKRAFFNGNLLGAETAGELGILKLSVNGLTRNTDISEFESVFQGVGKMKGVRIGLHVDKDVKPVAQKHRRVPFHLRNKMEAEIEKLLKAGIIEAA